MNKFDWSKLTNPKVIGVVFALGSAISAFSSTMGERKKDEEFKNLIKRVDELEKNKK